MATKVYFISAEKLKERTPLNFNIEDQLLTMSIYDAQETRSQPILGSELYRKLKNEVEAGTITGVYKTLLDDYVIPALIQWTMADGIIYLRYKMMNKSVASQGSDNTTPADLDEIKYLKSEMTNKAEFLDQRMIDYICANEASYPEYTSNDTQDDMLPVGSSYFSGIQLDSLDNCDKFLGKNDNNTSIV